VKKLIIIAGGWSVLEGIKKELWSYLLENYFKQQNTEIWSLNFSYKFMPLLPDRQIWIDKTFFEDNIEDILFLRHKDVALSTRINSKIKRLHYISNRSVRKKMEEEFKVIEQFKTNCNMKEAYKGNLLFCGRQGLVGIFATSLAILKGFKEIYWLGMDYGNLTVKDKKTHWYQDMIPSANFKPEIKSHGIGVPAHYRDTKTDKINYMIEDFNVFLKYKDVNIKNVSLQSNIQSFEKISYDEFFKLIAG
jgi:hypothetical protein